MLVTRYILMTNVKHVSVCSVALAKAFFQKNLFKAVLNIFNYIKPNNELFPVFISVQ